MARPRNIRDLGRLAPGSRQASQFLPVYRGPGGIATTDFSSPAGRVEYKRNYGYYYDTESGSFVTRRQRFKAITGWTSYEQAARERDINPDILPPTQRVQPGPRYLGGEPELPPLENPPVDYIPPEDVTIFAPPLRPIEEVVDDISSFFSQLYIDKRVGEGASTEEAEAELTSELLPQLETLVRERREVADDSFASREARLEVQDALNDFIGEWLDEDVDDFWSTMYTE